MKRTWRDVHPGETMGEARYMRTLAEAQERAEAQAKERAIPPMKAVYERAVLNLHPGEKIGRTLYLKVLDLCITKESAQNTHEVREIGKQINIVLWEYKEMQRKLKEAEEKNLS